MVDEPAPTAFGNTIIPRFVGAGSPKFRSSHPRIHKPAPTQPTLIAENVDWYLGWVGAGLCELLVGIKDGW